jgi:hypothetical protein
VSAVHCCSISIEPQGTEGFQQKPTVEEQGETSELPVEAVVILTQLNCGFHFAVASSLWVAGQKAVGLPYSEPDHREG